MVYTLISEDEIKKELSRFTKCKTQIKSGGYTFIGPSQPEDKKISAFQGDELVDAKVYSWLIKGPENLRFIVALALANESNPDESDIEIGQVFCTSRLDSPQQWDEVVGRLRMGIRNLGSSINYVSIRRAKPKANGKATRVTIDVGQLDSISGFKFKNTIKKCGAIALGSCEQVLKTNDKKKKWPCITYKDTNLLLPVVIWTGMTVAAIREEHKAQKR